MWLTSRAMRPVDDISVAASSRPITKGNLSERIDVATSSELGRLASVLNSTFARLEAAFTPTDFSSLPTPRTSCARPSPSSSSKRKPPSRAHAARQSIGKVLRFVWTPPSK